MAKADYYRLAYQTLGMEYPPDAKGSAVYHEVGHFRMIDTPAIVEL